jgi:hypothetical protein
MLQDVQVLVTICSTVAYHAMIHGVPVVTVSYLDPEREFDAYRYGGALNVTCRQGLSVAIQEAMENDEVRRGLHAGALRVIEDHLFRLDGGAANRIAQVISAVFQGRTSSPSGFATRDPLGTR